METSFDGIGDEASKGFEAIAIPAKALVPGVDTWHAYTAAIKASGPQVVIVFDKFHLICNYSKVIDRVLLEEFRKAEKVDLPILKGTKYLLLKDRENLTKEQAPPGASSGDEQEPFRGLYRLKGDLVTVKTYLCKECFYLEYPQNHLFKTNPALRFPN
ncbi:MAG: transposase [Anaerolineales bacterium]